MTISSEVFEVSHSGDDTTTAFPVTFPFFELVVALVDDDGVITQLTEGTHYTVSGGEGSTGTVNMINPPATGETLRSRRATSRLQETDYEENDPFPAEVHEKALDRVHMILTEQNAQIGKLRALPSDLLEAPELTVSSGEIEPTGSYHSVDTEGDAATDDLDTIDATDARSGDLLAIRCVSASRVVTLKDGTGNLILGEDRELDSASKIILLMYVGALGSWVEINRGERGAKGDKGDKGDAGDGSGDMLASTYDPGNVAGDAFSMDSMVEGATTKILTATERTNISNATAFRSSVIGAVMDFAGTSAPTGWLFCYGQAISRSTYSALFGVIGTTFGSGDGSTTFNLPDCRGRVTAGKDDMGGSSANRLTSPINGDNLGAAGGSQSHTLTTDEIPAHTHSGAGGGGDPTATGGGDVAFGNGNTGSTGGGGAHNNMQPTIILNKIIFAAA